MKVTKRDLILIIVLVYIVVAVCGAMFLIKPQIEDKQKFEAELEQVQQEKALKDKTIASIPALEKTIEELTVEIDELSANFYEYRDNPEVHIQTLIQAEINSLTKLNDLSIVAPEISATTKTVTDADPNANTEIDVPEGAQVIKNDPAQPVEILSTDVTITLEGSIDNLLTFADQIQQLKNVIEFNSVYVESKDQNNANNDVFVGTYVLSFTSVF